MPGGSCVYVGYLGLRGGMRKAGRQGQERSNAVNVSGINNRTVASVEGSQLHKTVTQEDDDHWSPPFIVREEPASSVLTSLQQDYLQLHAPSTSEATLLAHVPMAGEAEVSMLKNKKMPSLPRSTTFSTLAAAQEAVTAYMARWRLETTSGRAGIREQGKNILKGVEKLKKVIKRSYRQQVLGFETQDIDPLVWNRLLQAQRATQAQLNTLRGLRAQLLEVCQIHSQELQAAGVRTTISELGGEVELYSSDEDTQQLSDQERKNHAAFVAGMGKVLQKRSGVLLKTLLDQSLSVVEDYVQLFIEIPEFSELIGEYIEAFLQEEDEEQRAELLGGFLTEVILQFFPLPQEKANQLKRSKNKLGQAAQKIASPLSQQLNKLIKQGKTPKSISRIDTNRVGTCIRVHFQDGTALSKEGIWQHSNRQLSTEEIQFLKAHGWAIPA